MSLGALPVLSQDSVGLKQAILGLDKAMVAKDTAALNLYLDKKVSYGHSNGWVQSKEDVRNDFASGRVAYEKMESSNLRILSIDKEFAVVSLSVQAAGVGNEKPFSLTLHVMQVWKKDKKGWQLLARQGARLN